MGHVDLESFFTMGEHQHIVKRIVAPVQLHDGLQSTFVFMEDDVQMVDMLARYDD